MSFITRIFYKIIIKLSTLSKKVRRVGMYRLSLIEFHRFPLLSCSYFSTCMDVLSQPTGLTHRQRLLWLQKHRTVGLWVQCDDCDRWRYLPNVLDSSELPKKWYCRLHPGLYYFYLILF